MLTPFPSAMPCLWVGLWERVYVLGDVGGFVLGGEFVLFCRLSIDPLRKEMEETLSVESLGLTNMLILMLLSADRTTAV